jgi:signal transduction histidine kinase
MSLSELKRVTDLITDLLALGKSTTTAHTAVDVAETLEPVVRLMESTARKRQIGVAFTRNGAMPMVYANPNQLKQIILNLILNAIDASAPGAEVTVALHTKGAEQVLIEVLDRGAGIAPEKLAHIFDPFYTTKETGTGLGLALVHQMVREHGGEITVESAVGHGTAFRITLPGASLRQTGT